MSFVLLAIAAAQPMALVALETETVATVRRPRIKASGPRSIGSEVDWVTSDDYPLLAMREERQGVSQVRLTVDERGRVSRCAIVGSSGHADLDAAACTALTERARFAPAYDNFGDAVRGSYFKRVRWQLPSEDESVPDLSQLGDQIVFRARTVSYIVEIDGSISDCVERTEGNVPDDAPTGGCANLAGGQLPIVDDEGNPIRRRVTLTYLAMETDPDLGDGAGFAGQEAEDD